MLGAFVRFLLLSEAFAVATFAFGWWSTAVLAFAWAIIYASPTGSVRYAMISATAGWGELLLLDAARGPVGQVAHSFGGVLGFPAVALFGITLLFPAFLAWSAAALGAGLRLRLFVRHPRADQLSGISEPLPESAGMAVADV